MNAARQDEDLDQAIEILAAVLLSLATVMTTWCSYQSARWSSKQTRTYFESSDHRTRQARDENQAILRRGVQVNLFLKYVEALADGKLDRADFYYQRFPPELKMATDAWLATRPKQNPDAPLSPFEMPEYKQEQLAKAAVEEKLAADTFAIANEANDNSDRYVLVTVILASALFMCGISGKFRWRATNFALLLLGAMVLAAATRLLVTLPVQ